MAFHRRFWAIILPTLGGFKPQIRDAALASAMAERKDDSSCAGACAQRPPVCSPMKVSFWGVPLNLLLHGPDHKTGYPTRGCGPGSRYSSFLEERFGCTAGERCGADVILA